MLVVDAGGLVLFFNKACERLFGYTAAQVVGRHVRSLMPAATADARGGAFVDYFRVAQTDGDVQFQNRDGFEFSADFLFSTASTPGGEQHLLVLREPRGAKGEARLLELQADLMRMARMSAMEEMSGALAHKLNQPLTAVILYLQAIERAYGRETTGGALPERVVSILEKAVREAERASNMLQRMRQFREQRDPTPRLVDLNQVVEDAVELTVLATRPGTHVARLFAPRLPPVLVDPVQFQQALVNLIRGALDTIKSRGHAGIRIATHRFRDHVAVVVDVTGPAERGEQGKAPSAVSGGSRIYEKDLAISKAIAQDHGGDLLVDTDGQEQGTRFTLRLPLPVQTAAPAT